MNFLKIMMHVIILALCSSSILDLSAMQQPRIKKAQAAIKRDRSPEPKKPDQEFKEPELEDESIEVLESKDRVINGIRVIELTREQATAFGIGDGDQMVMFARTLLRFLGFESRAPLKKLHNDQQEKEGTYVFAIGDFVVKYSLVSRQGCPPGAIKEWVDTCIRVNGDGGLKGLFLNHLEQGREPSPIFASHKAICYFPDSRRVIEVMPKARGKTLNQLLNECYALPDHSEIYRAMYAAGRAIGRMHCLGLDTLSGEYIGHWVTKYAHGDGHGSNILFDGERNSVRMIDCWTQYANLAHQVKISPFYDFFYTISRMLLHRGNFHIYLNEFILWKASIEAIICFVQGYVYEYEKHELDVKEYVYKLVERLVVFSLDKLSFKGNNSREYLGPRGFASVMLLPYSWIMPAPHIQCDVSGMIMGVRENLLSLYLNNFYDFICSQDFHGKKSDVVSNSNVTDGVRALLFKDCPILDCFENRLKYAHLKFIDAFSKPNMVARAIAGEEAFVEIDIPEELKL